MKIAYLSIPVLALTLIGCGGSSSDGDSNDNSGTEPENCSVILSTISLGSGESCVLTQADADLFGTTAGLIECNAGTLTYGASEFSSGENGISFNGLNFVCASN